jgi:hypothetical protein
MINHAAQPVSLDITCVSVVPFGGPLVETTLIEKGDRVLSRCVRRRG